MNFDNNKPIYLQICDSFCDRILSGELKPEQRIPSVREYGADIGVNPNTVMRTYDKLLNDGIFFNKRGIGYFVCPDAVNVIMEKERNKFIETELPQFVRRAELLGLNLEEVLKSYKK